jgi:hypothetical protein
VPVPCPCGCGQSISRITKRTAERSVFVDSLAAVPTRLAEITRADDPDQASQFESFARAGHLLSIGMIESVHGNPLAQLPSAKAVGDWEADALKLQRGLQQMDPAWYRTWEGPVRNRVSGKGRKT